MGTKFEISWGSLWKVFFMVVFVGALFLARDAVMVLFGAIIISSAFDGIVSWLERKRISRILGTIFVFLAVIVAFSLLLYAIVPTVVFELQNFLKNASSIKLPAFGTFDLSKIIDTQKYINNLSSFAEIIFSGSGSFLKFAANLFGNLALIGTTFIASLYLTINKYGVENFLRTILPIIYEERVVKIYGRVRKKLGFWLQGEIVLMLLVGTLTFFGLWAFGIKYALLLGILTAFFEILPIVGPIISGFVAFAIALSQSWILAVYSLLIFLVVHQIESNILVPLIMKKAVGVNPVIVIISFLAGAQIAGLIGAILAMPITLVLQEIVLDWEKRKLRAGRLDISDE